MTEWQPWGTAPKDGSTFLAYYPEGEDPSWPENDDPYPDPLPVIATIRWVKDGYGWEGNTYFLLPGGVPTHWHPLPEAPAVQS